MLDQHNMGIPLNRLNEEGGEFMVLDLTWSLEVSVITTNAKTLQRELCVHMTGHKMH